MRTTVTVAVAAAMAASGCGAAAQVATAPRESASTVQTPSLTPRATLTARPTSTRLPTVLPSPTEPTLTSTPVPTLAPHKWPAEHTLIEFDIYGGDGGCCFHYPPAQLTLFSDGEVFTTRYDDDSFEVFSSRLSRGEVCSLLNTIDQFGFLDYEPAPYLDQIDRTWLDGGGSTHIKVNAWKSNSIALRELHFIIHNGEEYLTEVPDAPPLPDVPPSLRDTFLLLSELAIPDESLYQPANLVLWADEPLEWMLSDLPPARPWPMASPSIAQIRAASQYPSDGLLITGHPAREAFSLFDNAIPIYGSLFSEDGLIYVVFDRPLLPGEPPSAPVTTPIELSCTPADGFWMQ